MSNKGQIVLHKIVTTKIAIVTAQLVHYRLRFHNLLADQYGLDTTIFYERAAGLEPVQEKLSCPVVQVNAWGDERITWHRLPIVKLWQQFQLYVFSGNPRHLSTLAWASVLKLCGRRVMVWGHAHSPGAKSWSETLRLAWWRLFDHILVYTEAERQKLVGQGFSASKVTALNNGLDQSAIDAASHNWHPTRLQAWQQENGLIDRIILLSCGRIIERNRFDMVLQILPELLTRTPNLCWCVIGDGPERKLLQAKAEQMGLSHAIRWVGALYEEQVIAPWFLSSKCLIHPGAIGLALMHAFGYGVPVITHNNPANHGPEFVALKHQQNGLLFAEHDVVAFSRQIENALEDEEERQRWRDNALQTARTEYNTEVMAQRFAEAVALLTESKVQLFAEQSMTAATTRKHV